jgi:hypothetical protein
MLGTLLRRRSKVFESAARLEVGTELNSAPPRLARSQPPNDACLWRVAASTSTNDLSKLPARAFSLVKGYAHPQL